MPPNLEPHILIVGAGITGLIIAHGLRKAGVKYTIFETEDEGQWRSKEWSMGMHWGLPLLESLLPSDLAARIGTDGSVDATINWDDPPKNGACIYDGVNGDLLKDLAGTTQGRNVRVSRQRLRRLCQEGITITWSHTLESVRCSDDEKIVTARFTNGKEYVGTLLVGTDGPRSAVRDFLFAQNPSLGQIQSLQDHVGFSMAISYDAETAKLLRSAYPVWCLCISPELFVFLGVQDVSDVEKPESWKFFIFPCWLGERDNTLDNDGRMKALKDRGALLAEPIRTAILAIPNDTQTPYSDFSYWIAQPWDTHGGLVTLAGDSAHPMPPYRGQGGNHAVQDAHNFVEAVKKIVDAPENERGELQTMLMKKYSDEAANRGAEETKLSITNGYMMLGYSNFKESPYMKQGLARGKS